jgi:hypothetical protein
MIYIYKNNKQSGPYEEHLVLDQLKSGLLSPEDMAVRHGESTWQSLRTMFPQVVQIDAPRAVRSDSPPAKPVTPTGTGAAIGEPRFRKTALQKVFFAFCFLAAVGLLAACAYYIFTYRPSGSLEADLSRLGYRDLVRNLAIGTFVGAFFAFLAFVLSFKTKLIRSNGPRLALRVFFIVALLVGLGNLVFGAIKYVTYRAPVVTAAAESNELLQALESGSAATGPYQAAVITVPIGAGLFLFGLSGFLMTKRLRD